MSASFCLIAFLTGAKHEPESWYSATIGRGIMMKARNTIVLSMIAGSLFGAAAIQGAKPKVYRVVTIILAALGAVLSVARAETPVERGGR